MSDARTAREVIIDALVERDGYSPHNCARDGEMENYSRLAVFLAEKLAEEVTGPFYDKWFEAFAHPYSKPMHLEQNAELDGIEKVSAWLRGTA